MRVRQRVTRSRLVKLFALVVGLVIAGAIVLGTIQQPAGRASVRGGTQNVGSTNRVAWELGRRVSLAAMGHEAGAPQTSVEATMTRARELGRTVGVELPALPELSLDAAANRAAVVNYLMNDAGKPVSAFFLERHGSEAADLYELAIKSNMLLMLYTPGDSTGLAIAGVIKHNGPRAGLPAAVWQPVVQKVEAGAPYDEVKLAIVAMHTGVSKYFASR